MNRNEKSISKPVIDEMPVFWFTQHVCSADGLEETLSPDQREDNS